MKISTPAFITSARNGINRYQTNLKGRFNRLSVSIQSTWSRLKNKNTPQSRTSSNPKQKLKWNINPVKQRDETSERCIISPNFSLDKNNTHILSTPKLHITPNNSSDFAHALLDPDENPVKIQRSNQSKPHQLSIDETGMVYYDSSTEGLQKNLVTSDNDIVHYDLDNQHFFIYKKDDQDLVATPCYPTTDPLIQLKNKPSSNPSVSSGKIKPKLKERIKKIINNIFKRILTFRKNRIKTQPIRQHTVTGSPAYPMQSTKKKKKK